MFEDPNEAIEYFIWEIGSLNNNGSTREEIFDCGKKSLQIQLDGIFEELRPTVHNPSDPNWIQHILLVQRFKTIYTTNWDRAIEVACRANYYKIYPVDGEIKIVDDKGEEYGINDDLPIKEYRIIKYHGDSNEKYKGKSLVACETDYFNRIRRMLSLNKDTQKFDSEIDNTFLDTLKSNDILFLGYSFGDPNIKYLLNQLRMFISESIYYQLLSEPPKLYWVLPDYSEMKIQHRNRTKFLMNWKGIFPYFLLKPEESLLIQNKNKLIKERIIKFLEGLKEGEI